MVQPRCRADHDQVAAAVARDRKRGFGSTKARSAAPGEEWAMRVEPGPTRRSRRACIRHGDGQVRLVRHSRRSMPRIEARHQRWQRAHQLFTVPGRAKSLQKVRDLQFLQRQAQVG